MIVDDSKMINTEQNQLILKRGNQKPVVQKLFGKTRITLFITHSNDKKQMKLCMTEFLKPYTTYGLHCFTEGLLKDENILTENFETININFDMLTPNEQKEIVQNYHVGKTYHRGIDESYNHIGKKYYWPTLLRDIRDLINSCDICLKFKYEMRPIKIEYMITPTPSGPFEILKLDTTI